MRLWELSLTLSLHLSEKDDDGAGLRRPRQSHSIMPMGRVAGERPSAAMAAGDVCSSITQCHDMLLVTFGWEQRHWGIETLENSILHSTPVSPKMTSTMAMVLSPQDALLTGTSIQVWEDELSQG